MIQFGIFLLEIFGYWLFVWLLLWVWAVEGSVGANGYG